MSTAPSAQREGEEADGGPAKPSGPRERMANARTDWAEERTLLAKERTFSAWARTGVAAMAAGLGIARFIEIADAPWIARTVGVVLIAASAFVFVLGFLSYRTALRKLTERGVRGMPLWAMAVLTGALVASAGLAGWLVFQE